MFRVMNSEKIYVEIFYFVFLLEVSTDQLRYDLRFIKKKKSFHYEGSKSCKSYPGKTFLISTTVKPIAEQVKELRLRRTTHRAPRRYFDLYG